MKTILDYEIDRLAESATKEVVYHKFSPAGEYIFTTLMECIRAKEEAEKCSTRK